MEDAIYGLTLRDCAEIMSKDGELKAQYGERAYKPHLLQYLAQRGTDENTWAHAWNGWWSRMQSDPSGQLHAKFAMMQQELTMKAHMADVPDAGSKEGVSLDLYAQVMAKVAGGADLQATIAQHGIPWDQWQRAQAAWNKAMAEDVNHHITTQYGMLYAKYTPGFQQQMQGQIAGMMAADHAQRSQGAMQDDEPEKDYTFDDAVAELKSPKPAVRWKAAHHVANFWDIGDKEANPRLVEAARQTIPIFVECVERHDEFTVSDAETSASDLKMYAAGGLLGAQADDVKSSIAMCLNRAKEKLQTLQAAFAPIQNKAVPERVKMQSQIQDYTSLVETLTDILGEWDEAVAEAASAASSSSSSFGSSESYGSSAGASSGSAMTASSGGGGGFLEMLKRLPIIGNILRMLGL